MPGVSNLASVWRQYETDQLGLSYSLHYREERDFWAIRRSQPVQVDPLVSYPLVVIHLRFYLYLWFYSNSLPCLCFSFL